jgi:CRISPR system Cascade subunit CasB
MSDTTATTPTTATTATTPAKASPPEDRLIDHLEKLARDDNRAALAALRASLREGHALDGLRFVLPVLGGSAGRRREDDGLAVAGLFALHPESGPSSLASALGRAAIESDSVELRFRALLAASREDLPTHLRSAVAIVASKGTAIDWRDLHRALRYWDHPDDFVRREWARDFWAPAGEASANNTNTVPNAPAADAPTNEGTR